MAIRRPSARVEQVPVSKYHGRRMSEAAYLALPEEKPYLEYVDGVVLQKPMGDEFHGRLVGFLDYLMYGYKLLHGGDLGPERRVRLLDGSGFRLPDTAYWAPGRPSGSDSTPSLAIEVRSSDQTMAELRRKCRSFRANGVACCWLIDPYARTVEVFEADRDAEQLAADAALETAVMPGFSVPQADLWAAMER
ncbi:MAG TPA: Uma2 family endonuclease [Tepidiformaceae bacterium]|nr:Uma2 family endonuclease [Tepidiformaceae bacterium]